MITSVHDHHIRQVSVDVAARFIRLRTAYPEATAQTGADVAFEGVEGYVLLGDALGTILFDIEPVDAIELYREFADEMQRVYAKTGGHAPGLEASRPLRLSSRQRTFADTAFRRLLVSRAPYGLSVSPFDSCQVLSSFRYQEQAHRHWANRTNAGA